MLKVILCLSNVAVWKYMPTDLIKSTFENVLFKMSYSVDTLSTCRVGRERETAE